MLALTAPSEPELAVSRLKKTIYIGKCPGKRKSERGGGGRRLVNSVELSSDASLIFDAPFGDIDQLHELE